MNSKFQNFVKNHTTYKLAALVGVLTLINLFASVRFSELSNQMLFVCVLCAGNIAGSFFLLKEEINGVSLRILLQGGVMLYLLTQIIPSNPGYTLNTFTLGVAVCSLCHLVFFIFPEEFVLEVSD